MILALIAKIGVGGATGHVLEYRGDAIENLNMEQRMTICNMSIECGARAGLVAPDDFTFEYIANKKYAPKGTDWDQRGGIVGENYLQMKVQFSIRVSQSMFQNLNP